ncbi:hypothetical protein [Streptomyces sp. NPDC057545]|uniref:hypothetical protein n=1 Tax=Streptomyces sp. NPDC057545 TaxID=3346164 RepID=UPI00367ED641
MTQGGYRTTPHLTLSNQEFSVFKHRAVRSSLLASAVAVTLLVTAGQATTRAAESGTAAGPVAATATATFSSGAPAANPFDEVERLATAQEHTPAPAPAPGGTALTGQVPGAATPATAPAARTARSLAGAVPCTLDGITGLAPEQFADFLADQAVLADGCLRNLIFKDMSETVDYFILDRAGAASNNLADMNCSFGPVEIWTNKVAGTSSYSCEGPLRS